MNRYLSVTLPWLILQASVPAADPAPTTPGGGKPLPTPEEIFARLDRDKNGTLNLEEFRGSYKTKPSDAKISLAFRKKDLDANGKLTLAEFKAGLPKADAPTTPDPTPAKPKQS